MTRLHHLSTGKKSKISAGVQTHALLFFFCYFALSFALGACAPDNAGNIVSAESKAIARAPSKSQLLPILNVVKTAWPKNEWLRATCLAFCESSGNPGAMTPNGQYVGLFQVDKSYAANDGGKGRVHPQMPAWNATGMRCGSELFNPQINAQCGFIRLSRAGWGDWECHRKYQPRIQQCMAAHRDLVK